MGMKEIKAFNSSSLFRTRPKRIATLYIYAKVPRLWSCEFNRQMKEMILCQIPLTACLNILWSALHEGIQLNRQWIFY